MCSKLKMDVRKVSASDSNAKQCICSKDLKKSDIFISVIIFFINSFVAVLSSGFN